MDADDGGAGAFGGTGVVEGGNIEVRGPDFVANGLVRALDAVHLNCLLQLTAFSSSSSPAFFVPRAAAADDQGQRRCREEENEEEPARQTPNWQPSARSAALSTH